MANTIAEFLVSLGFTVDPQGQEKFKGAVREASFQAELASHAVEGLIETVSEMWRKYLERLEEMNEMSGRIGTTVQNLNAFTLAMRNAGGTVEGASSALEKFHELLIEPGAENYLKGLGVQMKDGAGHVRDAATLLTEAAEAINRKNIPYAAKLDWMKSLGLDERNMRAILRPEMRENMGRYRNIYDLLGLPGNEGGEAAERFNSRMREISNIIQAIFAKVASRITGPGGDTLGDFVKWLEAHAPAIAQSLGHFADAIIQAAEALPDFLSKLKDLWEKIDNVISKFTGQHGINNALILFGTIITANAIAPLVRLIAVLGTLSATTLPAWLLRLIPGLAAGAAIATGSVESTPGADTPGGIGSPEMQRQQQQELEEWNKTHQSGDTRSWWERTMPKWLGGKDAPGAGDAGAGFRLGDRRMMRGRLGGWWTKERMQHAIDRLQKEAGLSPEGAAGLVARWAGVEARGGPGSVNPNSGAAGIGQWLGSRRGGFTMGDYDSQLTKAIHELNTSESRAASVLRNAKTFGEGARGASMFERAEGYNPRTGIDNFTMQTPVGIVAEALGIGSAHAATKKATSTPWGKLSDFKGAPLSGEFAKHPLSTTTTNSFQQNQTVTQTNHITVNGADDPQGTAAAVTLHQGRVNRDLGDIVRNTGGDGAR